MVGHQAVGKDFANGLLGVAAIVDRFRNRAQNLFHFQEVGVIMKNFGVIDAA